MVPTQPYSKSQPPTLINFASRYALYLALLMGALIRFSLVLASPFPLNDGGMFYTMAQDLISAHFAIPSYTSYNAMAIPFAYPPLGIYGSALTANTLNIQLIDVFRWLPLLVNLATIPCYYLLSKAILRSEQLAGLATLFFAILPRSFSWLIVGGGVTRGFGFLFAILAIHQIYWMCTSKQWRYVGGATLFCGFTILSHPEEAWFTVLSAGLLFLFYGLHWRGIVYSAAVILGTMLIALPWLLTVATLHGGLKPFENAFLTGGIAATPFTFLLINVLVGFGEHTLLGVLGLIGMLKALLEKKPFLVFWLLLVMFGYPRAPQIFSVIPLAMLIAFGVERVIMPLIREVLSLHIWSSRSPNTRRRIQIAQMIILVVFFVYGVVTALATPIPLFTHQEADAMHWVAQHTVPNSRFLVLTNRFWFADSVSEWFPSLSQRQSLATVQGLEWLSNTRFGNGQITHHALQLCLAESPTCLDKWAQEKGISYTHVYLSKPTTGQTILEAALRDSPAYELIYDASNAVIFAKRTVLVRSNLLGFANN